MRIPALLALRGASFCSGFRGNRVSSSLGWTRVSCGAGARRGGPGGRRVRHSPGLAFSDGPARRSRLIPVLPGKVCFKEGRGLGQSHTARAPVRTRVLGLHTLHAPPSRAAAAPGALSAPARLRRPRRLRGAPARWQPRSPPGRPGGSGVAPAGATATLRRLWLEASRAAPSEALPWAPKPGAQGPSDQRKRVAGSSAGSPAWSEMGLVSGSPTGGPRAWQLPESSTRWPALSALGDSGCTHRAPRGGEGRAGEAVRGGIRGGKPPGLS